MIGPMTAAKISVIMQPTSPPQMSIKRFASVWRKEIGLMVEVRTL